MLRLRSAISRYYKGLLIPLVFILQCSIVYAQQNIRVSGTVLSSTGEPLEGASIKAKTSEVGTFTDDAGNFELSVPNGTVLVISAVGYGIKEATAGTAKITIILTSVEKGLDEVVVIGYGSKRKRDITNAVSTINLDDLGEMPSRNVTQMIQGQAPGVVVKQKDGRPGAEFEVRIRGVGSLGAGSNPLYVIDGFPVGISVGQNLNPNDIQSITVLKDAASTAIYGARGSNGVVLVTTKSGKAGVTNLNLSVDYGVQNIPKSRRVKVLNGPEFSQFLKEVYTDRIEYFEGRTPTIDEIPESFRHPEQTQYSTDWYDAIMNKNAPYKDVNLSLSSGKENLNSFLSLGYYKEDGAIIKTNYERFSMRTNITGKIKNFITLGWNLNATHTTDNIFNTDGRSQVVGQTLIMDPRFPIYDDNGDMIPYFPGRDGVFGFPNPVYMLHNIKRKRGVTDGLSNGFIEFRILKNLTFRSSANVRLRYESFSEFRPSTIGNPVATGSTGAPPRIATASESIQRLLNISTDQLLNYTPDIGPDHKLDFLAGYTAQEEIVRTLGGTANTFPDDLVPYLGNGAIRSSSTGQYEWSLLAYLARANYSYKDKYLFSASFRREGSSRFGSRNVYGDFPAVSAGWRMSEEKFMKNVSWIDDLKLRASWGVTGNNDIGNYRALAFMSPSNYVTNNSFAPGAIVSNFANAGLRWEKSNQLDLGFDLSMFNNQVTVTAEYYDKLTNDMLLPISIPAVSGFTTVWSNVGEVQNRGVELAVDYRTKIGNVNIRSNANITINRSKILEINGANDILWYGSFYGGYNVQKVGRPIGMIYGYDKLGIFNTQDEIDRAPKQDGVIPGGMKFRDANGDGEITYDTQDMVEIGNPNPKFTWGFTIDGDYKRFDFNILFMGAQGYDLYRNIEASTMNMDGVFNVLDKAKDRWRSPSNPGSNPDNVNSQGGTSYFKWSRESSNRYVYDASHFWIRSVTLGYNLPDIKHFKGLRVFLSANNLFLFTKYPGGNPDVSQRNNTELGNDDEAYPVPRTFAAGIKINL